MPKRRIIFVNRFAHPDISATSQILSDLARNLHDACDVCLVAGRQKYDSEECTYVPFEQWGNVRIFRVWGSRFGRRRLLGRLLDYLTFHIAAPLRVYGLCTNESVVIVLTDPPLISLPVLLVTRLAGAKMVNWVQDLFPETAIAMGMHLGGAPGKSILKFLRNISLRAATANVVIGAKMKLSVQKCAPKVPIYEIENWSPRRDIRPLPRAENPLAREWGIGGQFIVGYSGNLGRAHELWILLDSAAILLSRMDIVFIIIGEGAQKQGLLVEAKNRNLTNIIFMPYQSSEMLKYSLTLPDVHFVSLKPELEGMIVPSKFYGGIAAGRPILFSGAADGEIAKLIQRGRCGITVSHDDPTALSRSIERLCDNPAETEALGKNARSFFESEYDQPIAIAKWRAVLFDVPTLPAGSNRGG